MADIKAKKWRRKWKRSGELTTFLLEEAKKLYNKENMKRVTGKSWEYNYRKAHRVFVAFCIENSVTIQVHALALTGWCSKEAANDDPNNPTVIAAYVRRFGNKYRGWGR